MTVPADTLRKIADTSPFPAGRYGQLGEQGVIQRWEDAGMMPHLVQRSYSEQQAMALCDDAQFPSRELERSFYRGQDRLYLKADVDRANGSRIAEAAIARVKQDDPEAAQDYRALLESEGAQGLFQQLGVDARRASLAQLAKTTRNDDDLADVDEIQARQAQGRRM